MNKAKKGIGIRMIISALVCDDLPEERANLIKMLRTYEQEHGLELELETASDGAELLSLWRRNRWSIIFLDIYMPQLNGIEAARRLRKVDSQCEIVFVTTSRDHGMEGYELRALDYLTKPYSQQDVNGAMDWFIKKHTEKLRELTVRTIEGIEELKFKDISFIESCGHICNIHLPDRIVSVRRSIDELSTELDETFFRCHKSFLLNLEHVSEVLGKSFLTDNSESVPISASKLSESKSAFLAWRSSEMK